MLLAALCAAAPVAAAPLQAQGIISGLVVDSASGLAIAGATVRIEALRREVISDRTGRFLFTAVPAGSQTLATRYIGFTAASRSVTVTNGATATVTRRPCSAS